MIRKHKSKEVLSQQLKSLFKTFMRFSLVTTLSLIVLLGFVVPKITLYSADVTSSSVAQNQITSSASQTDTTVHDQNVEDQQQLLDDQTQDAENQLPPREETVLDDNAMTDVINSVVGGDTPQTLEILLFLTLLTLAPSILIMMTCFTRIIIVLSLLKNAMGLQQTPPSQVLVGMALFLTLFIMQPVISEIHDTAYKPYLAKEINAEQALQVSAVPIKTFMLNNTSNGDLDFFLQLADKPMPQDEDEVAQQLGLEIVVPAFITSELKRAFTMGFFLYIPFLVVDIVVSSTLMSLGMVMLPPAMVSMPFKILLFIVADGWKMLFSALIHGFE